MKQDFSCDYLIDITGLVDDGKNLYSCCHPSGVMCGKEDCPVVIDFHKRSQKDTVSSDYENPSATIDYKACPLLLLTWLSLPINPKKKDKMLRDIECARKFCAWWDAGKERCAVLSMARNK